MAATFTAYDAQQTTVDAIFSWSPILWGTRIVVLLVVAGGALVMLTLLMRLLRPSHLKRMVHGELPVIHKGRFSVMGQEIEISGADDRRDKQVAELKRQVMADHDQIDKLAKVIDVLQVKESQE